MQTNLYHSCLMCELNVVNLDCMESDGNAESDLNHENVL
jgi:hypothetical protein